MFRRFQSLWEQALLSSLFGCLDSFLDDLFGLLDRLFDLLFANEEVEVNLDVAVDGKGDDIF